MGEFINSMVMKVTQENNRKRKGPLLYDYIRQRAESKQQMGKNSTADLYLAVGRHFTDFRETRICRFVI